MAKRKKEYVFAVRNGSEPLKFSRHTWDSMPEGRYGLTEVRPNADSETGLPVAGTVTPVKVVPNTTNTPKEKPGGGRPAKTPKAAEVAAPVVPPADKADVNA